jgi:acyl-coenzyme A synthetase/AMP-(fatty) acid ligase
VLCTHADLMHLARNPIAAQFPGARFFHAFPPTTFVGTHWTLLFALSGALTSITQPQFDAARFLHLVETHGVSIAYLAPSALRLALELSEARERVYEGPVLLLYGGEPTDRTTIHRIKATFSRAMQLNIYSLTEGGAATCMLSPAEALRRAGSVGRPVPPTAASIRDGAGSAAPAGVRGEVWLRSAVRRSYHRDEQATTRTWTDDGWLRTGDMGHMDADGYLYVDGRAEELIRRGEYTVYPSEVEAALLEHPGVREAKVVGVLVPEVGQSVKALIVPRSGTSVTAPEIDAHCAERLIAEKRPNLIEIVEALPRNAAGKVSTRELTSRRSSHPK